MVTTSPQPIRRRIIQINNPLKWLWKVSSEVLTAALQGVSNPTAGLTTKKSRMNVCHEQNPKHLHPQLRPDYCSYSLNAVIVVFSVILSSPVCPSVRNTNAGSLGLLCLNLVNTNVSHTDSYLVHLVWTQSVIISLLFFILFSCL